MNGFSLKCGLFIELHRDSCDATDESLMAAVPVLPKVRSEESAIKMEMTDFFQPVALGESSARGFPVLEMSPLSDFSCSLGALSVVLAPLSCWI